VAEANREGIGKSELLSGNRCIDVVRESENGGMQDNTEVQALQSSPPEDHTYFPLL
jgi:hypothetical protein